MGASRDLVDARRGRGPDWRREPGPEFVVVVESNRIRGEVRVGGDRVLLLRWEQSTTTEPAGRRDGALSLSLLKARATLWCVGGSTRSGSFAKRVDPVQRRPETESNQCLAHRRGRWRPRRSFGARFEPHSPWSSAPPVSGKDLGRGRCVDSRSSVRGVLGSTGKRVGRRTWCGPSRTLPAQCIGFDALPRSLISRAGWLQWLVGVGPAVFIS